MLATPQKLIQLFEDGRRFVYQKDDVIIRPGDTPSGVYYLVSGWIKVYSLCLDGAPNIIMTLCPGEVFPLAWAVSGSLRDIGFAALGITEIRRIPHQHFLQAMRSDGRVRQDVVQVLASHFFALASEIDNLQYRSAREKVVFRLIFLARHLGQREGDKVTIPTRVTNDYIARSTNMTRETASRELSRLSRKQLIQVVNSRIVISDLLRLRDEISQHFNLSTLSLN